MDRPRPLPPKVSRHLPVHQRHDPVIINNAVRLVKVIMHEPEVLIRILLIKQQIMLQQLDPLVFDRVRVRDEVRPGGPSPGWLDLVELPE